MPVLSIEPHNGNVRIKFTPDKSPNSYHVDITNDAKDYHYGEALIALGRAVSSYLNPKYKIDEVERS